jgi:hypothetical protein
VTGIAEIEIVPNEIYLDISIKERSEKGKKLTLDFLENQLKTVLKSIEIPEKNLSISDVNAVLAKTGWWSEELFSVANYSLKVNGKENKDAAWYYPDTKEMAKKFENYVAFWKGVEVKE